jgi:ubiquinone/menaquinone biosynthesis C-methylase UbiE
MKAIEMHKYLMGQHRNIYQEAQLYEQNRKPVETYLDILAHPFEPSLSFKLESNKLVAGNGDSFMVKNHVIDFRNVRADESELHKKWNELNSVLVNYQQYLTPYVLLNSLSIYSYIGEKTGLNQLKDAVVVDVGAGTGQIYGTFFFHQESISYYLLDPNLRLVHDHFLRLYPKLVHYPLSHILCYAENLPFKQATADLVMSISSIDHFKDYKKFMSEAQRILKTGGHILIASHLDSLTKETEKPVKPGSLVENNSPRSFMNKVYNRLVLKFEFYARKFHGKKRGHVPDDHMHHFEDTRVLEKSLTEAGFVVEQAEVFNRNFFIKARKL